MDTVIPNKEQNEAATPRHVIIVHVLVWVVLFGLPFVYGAESEAAARFARRNFAMLMALCITFYANLLWAIDKLFFQKKYVWFIIANIVIFFLASSGRSLLNALFDSWEHTAVNRGPKHHDGMMPLFFFNDFISSMFAVGASLGISLLNNRQKLEIYRKKIENETLTSELNLLRYQIRPHFFFNCLNNIYSLISISPNAAQKAVHSLSRMMRFILYDGSNQTVSLSQEVDFLRSYVDLMKLRLRPEADIQLHLHDGVEDVTIPSLLFIPLIENAFKHGVSPNGEASIVCKMSVADSRLDFYVENLIFESQVEKDGAHSGIGLANLKKRLDIIYGDSCSFSAHPSGDSSSFVAKVSIPLTTKQVKQ